MRTYQPQHRNRIQQQCSEINEEISSATNNVIVCAFVAHSIVIVMMPVCWDIVDADELGTRETSPPILAYDIIYSAYI